MDNFLPYWSCNWFYCYSVDQDSANYFTADSTFGVPIILNTENLDSFDGASIEGTKEDSSDVPSLQIQSDISQEDASSQPEHPSTSLTDIKPSLTDNEPPILEDNKSPPLENNEFIFEDNDTSFQDNFPNELENDQLGQMQNLKVCIRTRMWLL